MKYYIGVLKKYAVFKGRASRKEFWMFQLFNIIVSVLIGIVFGIIAGVIQINMDFVKYIYMLFIFIPNLALTVRRTHDSNTNGWCILIPLYNFVLLFMKGTTGDNKYGPDPYVTTPLTTLTAS